VLDPRVLDPASAIVFPMYVDVLERADTYYMTPRFAALVDQARRTVPDDLEFDTKWFLSPAGFIWLDEGFTVPNIEALHHAEFKDMSPEWFDRFVRMQAVGWRALPPGLRLPDNARTHGSEAVTTTREGDYQIVFFQGRQWGDESGYRFYPWSHIIIRSGVPLGTRVQTFEELNAAADDGSRYIRLPEDTVLHPLHEIRWVYVALHLMAQKLAMIPKHDVDRPTRRRAEREGQQAPPFIRVITLRRLEIAKVGTPGHRDVEWNWQWDVVGHWRWQFYPSEGVHKRVWIESYVKGPPDKPFKSTTKLFVQRR